MTPTDLNSLYSSLSSPDPAHIAGERVFSVCQIPEHVGRFVGRSHDSHAAILLEIDSGYHAPVILRSLRAVFNVRCVLVLDSNVRTATVAVVECLSNDTLLRRYFFMAARHTLSEVGADATARDVVEVIDTLASLFQKLTRSPKRDVQGLVGELLIIDLADDPSSIINGWRTDPYERFDFVIDQLRIEVKTNAFRQRTHQFSFEQCNLPDGATGVVASIFVELASGGTSLESLVERIALRATNRPSVIARLHSTIADTLGERLVQCLPQCFDEPLAIESIAFYDLRDVPAMRGVLPAGVSAVRFNSELGSLTKLDVQQVQRRFPTLEGLFR